MLMHKEMLAQLKWLGLNSYESLLWTALLAKGTATAGDLAEIANVPRSRTYDVLESLERKGFIMMKLGKPIKYVAISPDSVIERVKKKVTEDAEERSATLDKLKETTLLNELSLLHKTGVTLLDQGDLSGSLKGRKNTYAHLENIIKSAESTITMMTTKEGLLRKNILLKSFRKAKQRGVKIRIAAPLENLSITEKEQLEQLKTVAELKHTNNQGRFCIIDGKHMVFMMRDDKETHPDFDVGIWVTTPFFAGTFEKMFENSVRK